MEFYWLQKGSLMPLVERWHNWPKRRYRLQVALFKEDDTLSSPSPGLLGAVFFSGSDQIGTPNNLRLCGVKS
mgnify:FL=1